MFHYLDNPVCVRRVLNVLQIIRQGRGNNTRCCDCNCHLFATRDVYETRSLPRRVRPFGVRYHASPVWPVFVHQVRPSSRADDDEERRAASVSGDARPKARSNSQPSIEAIRLSRARARTQERERERERKRENGVARARGRE
jgi:hypothetical protein